MYLSEINLVEARGILALEKKITYISTQNRLPVTHNHPELALQHMRSPGTGT